MVSSPLKLKGYIKEVQDSLVIFSAMLILKGGPKTYSDLLKISFNDINVIKGRRKGKMGRSIIIGAATGISVGIMIGYASGDDPPGGNGYSAKDKALSLGYSIGVLGAATGAIIGSSKKIVLIDGKYDLFYTNRKLLKQFISLTESHPETGYTKSKLMKKLNNERGITCRYSEA